MSIRKRYLNTMTGKISTSDNFIWDAHMHLWGKPYHSKSDEDLILNNEEMSLQELKLFANCRGSVVVEFSPFDFGRDWRILKRLSEATGINILSGTGFYTSPGLDHLLPRRTPEEWYELIVDEALNGEKFTQAKPSFLKWATSLDHIAETEYTSSKIIVEAHKGTNLPIVTHTQRGTMVQNQLDQLDKLGADLTKVLISHIDMRETQMKETLLDALSAGASISFDQLGKVKYGDDEYKLNLILELCALGYSEQILLGTDIGRISNFASVGGAPGLAHIPSKVIPMFEAMKVEPKLVKLLVNDNPSNFYGVEEKKC